MARRVSLRKPPGSMFLDQNFKKPTAQGTATRKATQKKPKAKGKVTKKIQKKPAMKIQKKPEAERDVKDLPLNEPLAT